MNLSPAGLFVPGLSDVVSRALDQSGLAADHLVLEISERTVLDEREGGLLGELQDLRTLGVSLALDDFGAGCTSLSQLRELPVDLLKVDRAFVARVGDDRGEAILAAIVALAHTLDIVVVAEGVEQPNQVTRLRELGCDAGQGFVFSRPRPVDELRAPFME